MKTTWMNPLALAILAAAILGNAPSAWARPEYALKEKLNCVQCHATPWGGGPRNLMGKTYGSHGFPPAKTSLSDLYYASLRFIAYYPFERASKRTNGAALMEAAVTGNVPVIQSEDGSEMRGVLTLNAPTLGSVGPREAYIRWQLPPSAGRTPTHITLGRFYVPFGLLTDEHRTYTRVQTNSTINNFDIGVIASTHPAESLQLDLGVVSDYQTGGKFNTNDVTWGVIGNARWNPEAIPLLFGLSGNYEHTITKPQPYAGSFYTGLTLDRLTSNKLSGSLLLEGVLAKNWNNPLNNTGQDNPGFSPFFIPPENSSYQTSILGSTSFGIYSQFKYNITHVWTLVYKFDYLAPDKDAMGTTFSRHGAGFEAYLNSNLIWTVRAEKALVPGFINTSGDTPAVQDDIFTVLRLWI